MEDQELKRALESLLFITDHPLPLKELCKITGVKDGSRVGALVTEIRKDFEEKGSGVQVLEVADGFQMATRASNAKFVRKLFTEKMTMRLSQASLETLSIISYKQPLTRAEVEAIRGVEVIASLETLLEKGLIEVVGRKESVGRPLMYGTTKDFLRHFGFKDLEDLPPLADFEPPPPGPGGETSATAPTEGAAEVPAEASEVPADAPVPEQPAAETAAPEQPAAETAAPEQPTSDVPASVESDEDPSRRE